MQEGYKKKASYKDSFEDLYLRHDYLRKIEEHDVESINKYDRIAKVTARIMYNKQRMTYEKVSFYYDDILNITKVYVAAFVGLYSFKKQPDKLWEFQNSFHQKHDRFPSEEEIGRKERNNLINFLRQRLITCSVSCERKSRNIVVGKGERVFFAHTALTVPASDDAILENPELFGYRPLSTKEVNEIKDKKNINDLKDKKGFKIIAVESHSQIPIPLFVRDFENSDHTSSDNFTEITHGRLTPSVEESLLEYEEESHINALKEKFNNLSEKQRKLMLSNFIRQNKDNIHLSDEVKAARKLLKVAENWADVMEDSPKSERERIVKRYTDVV